MTTTLYVVGALYGATIGGFLWLIAGILSEARDEREASAKAFADEREASARAYVESLLRAEEDARKAQEAWTLERAALLERIQRPEFIPPTPLKVVPQEDVHIEDDLHLVGTIQDESDQPA